MPLSQIALVLNSFCRSMADRLCREFRFVSAGREVFACWGDRRLESCFLPVRDAGTGELRGHEAILVAERLDAPGEPAAPLLPADGTGAAPLDCLIRTLHGLGYLLQPERGDLFLPVGFDPREKDAPVFAFEEILGPCRLLPERIVLEYRGGTLPAVWGPAPPTGWPGRKPISCPDRC